MIIIAIVIPYEMAIIDPLEALAADLNAFYSNLVNINDIKPEYCNTEWFKWRKQDPVELRRMATQNQLPPNGISTGKPIIPRARAHLPAGIRFREGKPNVASTA